jgi:drug/metabolite transporter (DMT)-like permease
MQKTVPFLHQQATKADAKGLALGICVGLLAASIGALYTVFARWGITRGLSSPDLTALRFGVSGIATLPLILHAMLRHREILLEKWRVWVGV